MYPFCGLRACEAGVSLFLRELSCGDCHGTGAEPGSVRDCPSCRGQGKIIDKPCQSCKGKGTVQNIRNIEVSIPLSVDDGQFLRIPGEGEPGENKGPPGDLYAVIHIRPDRTFERRGADLYSSVVIGLGTALLGGEAELPTITGTAHLKIPRRTQSHTLFRLMEQDMRFLNSDSRGDLLVKAVVKVPEKLSKKQEELVKEAFAGEK